MGFKELTEENNGAYKNWLQSSYIGEHTGLQQFNGVCFAVSVIYLLRNAINQTLADELPQPYTTQFLGKGNSGLLDCNVTKIHHDLYHGSLRLAKAYEINAKHLKNLKYTDLVKDGVGIGYVKALQTMENNRSAEAREKKQDPNFDSWRRLLDMRKGLIEEMSGGLIKQQGKETQYQGDEIFEIELDQGYYLIEVADHTMACVVRPGKQKFLDPDEGQAIFKDPDDLNSFVSTYLGTDYEDELITLLKYR